jgi:hypothetical protein
MQTTIKMQFDPDVARDVGVEEAIMYSNLQFWCVHNKANGRHHYDDRYWTYNTYSAFVELFPFWTEKQIRRILKNLEGNNYIKVGNYNRKKYDKTKWYSTDCPIGQMDAPEQADGSDQTGKPIPDNKLQIINPDGVPHGTKATKSLCFGKDIDLVLEKIKSVVRILDGNQEEHRNIVRNFLDNKTPEILRTMGNFTPSRDQIINATVRIFQLARQDKFHSMNCTSLKYVYSKAGAIVMSAQAAKPKVAIIS